MFFGGRRGGADGVVDGLRACVRVREYVQSSIVRAFERSGCFGKMVRSGSSSASERACVYCTGGSSTAFGVRVHSYLDSA